MIALAAVVALIAAEGLGFYAVAELLASGGGGTAGWWAFVAVAFAGYGLPRLAEAAIADARRRELATTALGALLVYGCLRISFASDLAIWDFRWIPAVIRASGVDARTGFAAFIAGVLLGGTWIRMVRRSSDGIERDLVPRQLGFELALVTAVILTAAFGGHAAETARAGAAFYAVAVLALACSQLSLSGASIDDREAGSIVTGLLLGTLGAVIGGVVLIGVVFAWAGPIIGPPVGAVIDGIMVAVLTPFAYLATWVAHLFMGQGAEWPQLNVPTALDAGKKEQEAAGGHSAAATLAIYALRALLLAGIAAGAYALVRWLTRVRDRVRAANLEDPTGAASGSLRDDLAGVLRAVFHRESHHHGGAPAGPAVRLYLDVLAASERRGRPRDPARTASEFAPELSLAFETPVTDEITRAFEQARYAGREPSPEAVRELERRWHERR